ncbi:MAG: HIT family protein [archaeon]
MEHMKNNILFETEFWKVILADNQEFIGRCVVDVKSKAGSLSELSSEEWKDLQENVIKKLESAIKKAFGAELFNWSCLMNNAFRPEIKNPKPHVHFHCMPRYRNEIVFMGETFLDKQFGDYIKSEEERSVNQEVFDEIKKEITKNFP